MKQNSKAQNLGPATQPWETDKGILAFCLYLAGVPFLTTRNLYTADTLRAHGFRGETDLLEAARACVAANKKGNLRYLFKRPRELKGLLAIFTDQKRRIAEDDGDAMAAVHALMESYAEKTIDLHEAVMRIACLVTTLRGDFLSRWREREPLVQFDNPGRSRTFETTKTVQAPSGTRTVPCTRTESPGFRIVSANVSDKTKKKMGLE